MSKIPAVTFTFWVMKILATTLGETGGDFLSKTLELGYGVSSAIFLGFFVITFLTQLAVKSYHPAIFWLVIVATSTAGTTMSDYMDRTMKLGYATGSAILVGILAVIFTIWYFSGESLAVEKIRTRKVELFYWVAILFSNTLGTALGDFLADDSGLGFAGGAAVIGSALALVATAYYFTKISHVILFWIAFVLTRPFGATMGDVLVRDRDEGGLGYGTKGASAVLLGALVVMVLFVTFRPRKADTQAA